MPRWSGGLRRRDRSSIRGAAGFDLISSSHLSGGSSPGRPGEAAALVLAIQEFVASGGGRPSLRRGRSAASPGRTGSRGGAGRRSGSRSRAQGILGPVRPAALSAPSGSSRGPGRAGLGCSWSSRPAESVPALASPLLSRRLRPIDGVVLALPLTGEPNGLARESFGRIRMKHLGGY
jgi:hypothetical protein